MGYRGKIEQQEKARLLRAEHYTLQEIADLLGVAKSSVSLWCRDIDIEVRRRAAGPRRPNALHTAKLNEIAECEQRAAQRLEVLSEQTFLAAGVALYAGEGSKTDGKVLFANTNAEIVSFFCRWLRTFSLSTRAECGHGSTCTKASISLPPWRTGVRLRASLRHSSERRTGRHPTRASAMQNTDSAVSPFTTAAPGRTEKSWGSSERC